MKTHPRSGHLGKAMESDARSEKTAEETQEETEPCVLRRALLLKVRCVRTLSRYYGKMTMAEQVSMVHMADQFSERKTLRSRHCGGRKSPSFKVHPLPYKHHQRACSLPVSQICALSGKTDLSQVQEASPFPELKDPKHNPSVS